MPSEKGTATTNVATEGPPVEKMGRWIGKPHNRRKDIWGVAALYAEDEKRGDFDLKLVEEMKQRDATIRSAWRLTTLVMKSHLGTYRNPNPEHEAFVNEAIKGMVGWSSLIDSMLGAPYWGFAATEVVWADTGPEGRWVMAAAKPRHPKSLTGGWIVNKDGDLIAASQKVAGKRERIPIPMPKLVHHPFDAEFGPGEQPEGQSLLEPATRHYLSTKALIPLWNLLMEQGPRPLLEWATAGGKIRCPYHDQMEERVVVYTEAIERLEQFGALVYEGGEDVGAPTVLSNEHVHPEHYETAVIYHDAQKGKAVLVPRMLVDEPEHATRAMSQTQYTGAFLENLKGMQGQLEPVLVGQVAKPMLVVNFAGVTDFGEWVFLELQPDEVEVLGEFVYKLVQSGAPLVAADWKKIRARVPQWFVQPGEEGYEEFEAEMANIALMAGGSVGEEPPLPEI